ncbi:MAG: hypothetical protein PCFJNLEI_04134 [Verrucomicrobiae bacterium]|nr:hypothetical protein [Verrucomicrobiae bacterium]
MWTVLKRDDYTCRYPGCEANTNLDAAHLLPVSRRPEMALFVPNGVTLCRGHHDYLHNHPLEWERFVALEHDRRMKEYGITVNMAA